MIDKDSLIWAFAQNGGWYLLVIACEAIPNEEYEVEVAIYAGKQCGKEIVWIDSFGMGGCTLDDVEDLADLAEHLSGCPVLIERARTALFGQKGVRFCG